jgi:antagonist of KipI
MDDWSARLANRLAGNPDGAAVVEVTWTGPTLVADGPIRIAVAGAAFDLVVDGRRLRSPAAFSVVAGSRVEFDRRLRGARAYLAAFGGIDVPPVLGSRATDVRCALGGLAGRRLARGDRLPVGGGRPPGGEPEELEAPSWVGAGRLRALDVPHGGGQPALFGALCARTYRLDAASDRTGYRLTPDRRLAGTPAGMTSQPVVSGAVQVPPDGRPVLLMADRQPTGGYLVVAVVAAADLPLAGQLGPSDACSFVPCTLEEAREAAVLRERELDAMAGCLG